MLGSVDWLKNGHCMSFLLHRLQKISEDQCFDSLLRSHFIKSCMQQNWSRRVLDCHELQRDQLHNFYFQVHQEMFGLVGPEKQKIKVEVAYWS